jgi:hypothetical protein
VKEQGINEFSARLIHWREPIYGLPNVKSRGQIRGHGFEGQVLKQGRQLVTS